MNRDAVENPDVMITARMIASRPILQATDVEGRDYRAIHAIWKWVRGNIAFVMDTSDGQRHYENLADCENILRMRAADCDEHVILTGAMLRSIGFGRRVRGRDGRVHDQIEVWVGGPFVVEAGQHMPAHVFLVCYTISGRPVIVDTTINPGKPFGSLAGSPEWRYWLWDRR